METGLPKFNRIEPALERDGSPHLVITNKIPQRDAKGRVIGLAGFSRRIKNLRAAPVTMRRLNAAGSAIMRTSAVHLLNRMPTSPARYRRDHRQPAL